MPAYLVAEVAWRDLEKRKEYVERLDPILEKYGGRPFELQSGEPVPIEGDWRPKRIVLIEFPTMDALKAWYNSEEYAPLIRLRNEAAMTKIVAVEGSPPDR